MSDSEYFEWAYSGGLSLPFFSRVYTAEIKQHNHLE